MFLNIKSKPCDFISFMCSYLLNYDLCFLANKKVPKKWEVYEQEGSVISKNVNGLLFLNRLNACAVEATIYVIN